MAKSVKKTKKSASKQTIVKKDVKPSRYLAFWRSRPKWQRIIAIIAGVVVGLLIVSYFVPLLFNPVKNPNYGTSFSIKYAKELGNDWKANYTALLDDMGFKNFRLMSYWDIGEPEQGKYNFDDLDWQMDEAAKRGAKVSLAIGFRQPRWPECHNPDWAKKMGYGTDEWQSALNNYISVVQNRYKSHPALASYQLENEAMNAWFGECPGPASSERLVEEFKLAKANDPNHPVFMSLSDQHGFPVGNPVPDQYGFSVYRVVWNDKGPVNFYLTYPTPVWYHRLRILAINLIKHREVFIHELQIEPWGPSATVNLSVEEQNRSMGPKQINKNIKFVKDIGRPDIYVWGGEWWYWRKTHFNDPTIWDTVKTEIQSASTN